MEGSNVRRTALSALIAFSMVAMALPMASVSAQTQVVTASPGEINLGLTTSIAVAGPTAGTYTVVVDSPSGASTSLPYTFSSAGQVVTNTYGSATSGFNVAVSQAGTYNVIVEQGTTVVGQTSFYATNKLFITMDMVTGGTCAYILSDARGYKFIPRFYVYYASNPTNTLTSVAVNATATPNLTHDANLTVSFTQPNGAVTAASWDAGALLYRGLVQPAWNYTNIGPWNPVVTASDAAGNTGTFKWTSTPFSITAATLATATQILDVKTGAPIASIYPGESITISSTVTYPANAETVSGFVTGLDSVNRGGVVNAIVGWGYWNATAGTFGGSAANPGGVLGTVKLTNTNGANGTWTGSFTVPSSLPTIPKGASFAVAIISSDKANPPNTGTQVVSMGLAPTPSGSGTVSTTTVTAAATTSTTTATQTIEISGTQTLTPVTTTVAGAVSTITTTTSQVTNSIPTIVYAGMVALLVVGLVMGLLVRMPKTQK